MNYLDATFFNQKTLTVAKKLIGCYLVRKTGDKTLRLKITETEAYVGPHDLACHASKGRTKRTEVLFGEPGTLYVYMIYGMYYMLNVVSEEKEYPAAILIRSAGPYVGPGRLTRALGIDMQLNGKQAIPENGLWFEPCESKDKADRARKGQGKKAEKGEKTHIQKTKRIGVKYAGLIWAEKEYRFVLCDQRGKICTQESTS